MEIENVKKIKAIQIVPKGSVVTITGQNGVGKSSILDSIEMTLTGAGTIPERPIRDGNSSGYVIVDLGEIIITRSFTKSGPSLIVKAADGSQFRSPQAILDSLIDKSGICMDPLAIIKMSRDKVTETVRKLVGVDFTELDKKKATAYEERRLVNRELEAAKAKISNFPFDEKAPQVEVSVAALMQQLGQVRERNQANVDRRQKASDAASVVSSKEEAIRLKQEEIDVLKANFERALAALELELNQMKTVRIELEQNRIHLTNDAQTLVDEDEKIITDQITAADETNTRIRTNRRHNEIKQQIETANARSEGFTREIEGIDKTKQEMLEKAKFPLPDMSFNDSGVILNGLPFHQASTAQKIKAAVAIGVALNPTIRVILVRSGNDLDDAAIEELHRTAEERNVQCWIETIRSSDPAAVEIVDGEIKGDE